MVGIVPPPYATMVEARGERGQGGRARASPLGVRNDSSCRRAGVRDAILRARRLWISDSSRKFSVSRASAETDLVEQRRLEHFAAVRAEQVFAHRLPALAASV